MKKTLSINLNGMAINIDEDAYTVLKQYISQLENKFNAEDGREIIKDIEARISELFLAELNSNKTVITIKDVNKVIETLGSPEEISEDENQNNDKEKKTYKDDKKKYRKFYRDIDNKFLGGIAAGIAAYTGIDVVFIRLILIILTIFGFGYIIPVYFLLWLTVRPANTTAQKLEMHGIEPSIENIKNFVNNDDYKDTKRNNSSSNTMKNILRIIAILGGIFFGGIGAFVIGLILIILFSLLIGGSGYFLYRFIPISFLSETFSINPWIYSLFAISLILLFIIPIVSIIRYAVRLINSTSKPRNKVWTISWIIIWIISLIITISILFMSLKTVKLDNFHGDRELRLKNIDFNKIEINEGFKVELQKDSVSYIEIIGFSKEFKNIITKIEDNTLKIKYKRSIFNPYFYNRIKIHYNHINSISVSSASTISNTNDSLALKSSELILNLSSAAVANLNIDCKYVNVKSESASKTTLNGQVDFFNLDLSSAAVANIDKLNIKDINATISSAAVINGLNENTTQKNLIVEPGAVVN